MTHAYLVVATYTRDDFPLRLFDELEKAERFAKRHKWEQPPDKLLRAIGKERTGVGALDAIDVRIVRFTNGVPDSTVVVKSVDDED